MKRLLLTIVIPAALVCFSSCDFIRTVAGRPTSVEIEAMRVKKEEAERAEKESKAREQLALRNDKAMKTFEELEVKFKKVSELSSSIDSGISAEYTIIVGAFSKKANALRQSEAVAASGHKAVILNYANGNMAVGVDPSDKLYELLESYLEVYKEKYCPVEAWILVNE